MTYRTALMSAVACAMLAACGGSSDGAPVAVTPPSTGGGGGTTPTPPVATSTELGSFDDAKAFLLRGSWGGTESEIDALVGTDAADWLRAEFAKGPTDLVGYYDPSASLYEQGPLADFRKLWWDDTLSGRADLRARTTFALSQILVASAGPGSNINAATRLRMSVYLDVLSRHAFGNYRDLLEDVTYTPQMGEFLTYFANRKAADDGSRQPDENYAREIMQLFTIGLVELNMDGTPKLDASGQPMETYTNADVQGLARVFTGLASRKARRAAAG